jgi:exopolyphosphatase/guanosine-5'-triphosphate,3'-diphosphate pyrophosphatase
MHGKSLLHKTPFSNYIPLLPQEKNLLWLNFIYALTILLHEASHSATFRFHYDNKTLRIISDKPLYLTKEKIKTLQKPIPFAIIIEDEHHIPSSKILEI